VKVVGQLVQLEADKGKAKDKTPHKAKKRTGDEAIDAHPK